MAKKKVSAFRGKVQQAAAKASTNESSYGYLSIPKGISFYSPTAGSKEKFDILPYTVTSSKHPDRDAELEIATEGTLWYKRPYRVHRDIGVDKDRYICLTSFGKKCPICEYRAKRAQEGATKEELKAFNSSQRNLYAVVPRGIAKVAEEVHLFDFSDYNFQELINEELLENDAYEVFPDAEEGLTLEVRWNEAVFAGNTFAKAGRIDFRNRKTPLAEELLESVPNLDDLLQELTYAELEKIFFEMVDVEEEDEDVQPAKKSTTTTKENFKKGLRKQIEEDEDEDEESPFEAPAKKSAKPVPAKQPSAPAKSVKPAKKAKELTWEDLADMEGAELADVIEAKGLEIDTDDYDFDTDLRVAVAEELGIEIPEPEEELTWEELEEKDWDELCELIDEKELTVDTDDKELEELRKEIAEELGIEVPKPAKKTAPAKTAPAKPAKQEVTECPFGYKFGKDVDKKKQCADCSVWGDCLDASESE